MKNILVLAHDDLGGEARMQCALDLTRAFGGHLTAIDVTRVPAFARDYLTTAGDMCAFADEQERETKNASRLKARLQAEDVAWDWIDVTGFIAETINDHVGLSDIVVLSTALREGIPEMAGIISDVVEAGGLVLAVPAGTPGLSPSGPVVFGWDGSKPAMATLKRAVPLLKLASTVILVSVDRAGKEHPAEEAARYLSRHGVSASIERRGDGIRAPDYDLLQACHDHGAAYCAIGAYGHSRGLQNWFGGVTRRLIETDQLPILIGR